MSTELITNRERVDEPVPVHNQHASVLTMQHADESRQ